MDVYITSEQRQLLEIYKEAAGGDAGREKMIGIIREGKDLIDDPILLDQVRRLLVKIESMTDEEFRRIMSPKGGGRKRGRTADFWVDGIMFEIVENDGSPERLGLYHRALSAMNEKRM